VDRPSGQKHSSVGTAKKERKRELNRPAYSPDAVPAKLIEGFHQAPRPACPQPGEDLLLQAPQPMALTRSGTAGRPSEVGQAMSKAFADIGDGGLKSAPVACGADRENRSAAWATVSGKGQSMGAAVKVGETGSVAPQPPSASRAKLDLGPLKSSATLTETLDANVNGQYQCSAFGEFYSLCLGVRSVATTPYPISSTIYSSPSRGRHNQTNPQFLSRDREQNHGHSVRRLWETTPWCCC
jgi:hypothetical protein